MTLHAYFLHCGGTVPIPRLCVSKEAPGSHQGTVDSNSGGDQREHWLGEKLQWTVSGDAHHWGVRWHVLKLAFHSHTSTIAMFNHYLIGSWTCNAPSMWSKYLLLPTMPAKLSPGVQEWNHLNKWFLTFFLTSVGVHCTLSYQHWPRLPVCLLFSLSEFKDNFLP